MSRRDRRQILGAAVAAALLTGALAVLQLETEPPPDEPKPEVQAVRPASPPASPNEPDSKVQERAVAPTEPLKPLQPVQIGPPYLILDGLTFSAGLSTFTLAGLEGPPAAAACRDEDGHRWACGLQARAALNNAIQKHALTCVPVRTVSTDAVEAHCRAGESDIGAMLVAEGWARPRPGAEPSPLAPALAQAQQEKRGLWKGGWTYTGDR